MNNPRRIQRHLVKALAAGALLVAAALPLAIATAASAAATPALTSIAFTPSGAGNTIGEGATGTFTLTGVGFAGNGGSDALTATVGTGVSFSSDTETASTTTITGDYAVTAGATVGTDGLSFTDAANATPLTLASAFTVTARPVFNTVSPDNMGVTQPATSVTLSDNTEAFESGATVSFTNASDATTLTVGASTLNADGSLTVSVTPTNSVSAGAATLGFYNIKVTNPDGGTYTLVDGFSVLPVTISEVSPSEVALNATGTAVNTTLTITGSGFEFGAQVSADAGCVTDGLSFPAGTVATNTDYYGNSTFVSGTSLTVVATVAAHSTTMADCDITVTNPPLTGAPAGIPNGNADAVTLAGALGLGEASLVAPIVTGSSATAATAITPGAAPSTITFTGLGFGLGADTIVDFTDAAGYTNNGVSATDCIESGAGTSLTCVVTVGSGAVAGTDSVSINDSSPFADGLYVAGPSITAMAPTAIVVGAPVGTVVALTGTGFTNTMTGSVAASGLLDGIVQYVSATSANFVVTASPTSADITTPSNVDTLTLSQFVAAGVTVSSAPFDLTVDGPPVVTSAITYATAGTSGVGVGATAQGIVIHGEGFATGATVTAFTNTAGVADANVTVTVTAVNAAGTQITATVAVAAGDTNTAVGYTVTNTDGGKAVVSAYQFPITIDAGPTITSVSPAVGIAAASNAFTITGTGFTASSVASIDTNGSCGATTFVSATSLTVSCTLGAAQSTASNLLVKNPDGGSASTVILPAATTTPPPAAKPFHVSGVSGRAVVGRTVSVTITGTGFHGQPHITSNAPGTKAIVSHDSGTRLVVRVTTKATTKPGVKVFTVGQGAHHAKVHYTLIK